MKRKNGFAVLSALPLALGLFAATAWAQGIQRTEVNTVTESFAHSVPGQTVGTTWGESSTPSKVVQSVENGVQTMVEQFEDGTTIVTESFDIGTDGQPVGASYGETTTEGSTTPLALGDSSYAHSTEHIQYVYKGVGRATANVYQGQRITRVCFWWSRGGTPVTGQTCSNASKHENTWHPGPEVMAGTYDRQEPYVRVTTFNIKTTRIAP